MGDDIVTEENNPYTEIEGDITGMPIVVVDDFKAAVKEPVVKVLMNKEAERLVEVEKTTKTARRPIKRDAFETILLRIY